jgi:hypothetical protein
MRDPDNLLYVISARQEMSWPSFRRAFDALHARTAEGEDEDGEPVQLLRWRALRLLDWLGHCDVSVREDTDRIYAAPAVLARLPLSGPPQAVLCGSRSPRTADALAAACRQHRCGLRIDQQAHAGGGEHAPARLAVEAEAEEPLAAVARALHVTYAGTPPAWGLLQFAGTLDEYLQSRPRVQARDLNWARREYEVRSLQFRMAKASADDVRLSVYEHPVKPATLCLFWHGGAYREVDRDWGRYALLRHAGVEVLVYDPQQFVLLVPSGAPLPRLFARACVLCSGHAPRFVRRDRVPLASPERIGFHVFRGVPPAVARTLAGKLRQRLTITKLGPPARGVA